MTVKQAAEKYLPEGYAFAFLGIYGSNVFLLVSVIIYLHGGPSSPDGYVSYGFTDYLADDYTVIAWDQRGCGRTYMHTVIIMHHKKKRILKRSGQIQRMFREREKDKI